jgi:hypothetical protein
MLSVYDWGNPSYKIFSSMPSKDEIKKYIKKYSENDD